MFHEEFFSALWYNTSEYLDNVPILNYQNTIKTGVGYESGEFDVYPNGSLIINLVSLQHDSFTVVYLHTKKDLPMFIHIKVEVVGKYLLVQSITRTHTEAVLLAWPVCHFS